MPSHSGLDHKPPDWLRSESDYFITICADPKGINHFCHASCGPKIIDSIRHYHEQRSWFCHVALLMPDHIHLLVRPHPNRTLSQVLGLWKRWLTKNYDISWQANFFDHRLRSDESLSQKADYILHNPVRAGLVKQIENWPYVWRAAE